MPSVRISGDAQQQLESLLQPLARVCRRCQLPVIPLAPEVLFFLEVGPKASKALWFYTLTAQRAHLQCGFYCTVRSRDSCRKRKTHPDAAEGYAGSIPKLSFLIVRFV